MKRILFSGNSRSRSAFTIIELLVAVGVTALMVSLMLTIVVNVLGGWNRSSGSLTSGNQARTVMDIITRDLQSAIVKRDGKVWLAATIQASGPGSGPGIAWSDSKKPTDVEIPAIPGNPADPLPSLEDDYKFGQGGVWLRFFSTIPGTGTNGDISAPRAIAYQLIRRSVAGSSDEQRYMLYRSEVMPADTFTLGYDLFDAAYYSGLGVSLRTPPVETVIANDVVDFGVRFLKRNSTGLLVAVFPTTGNTAFAATSIPKSGLDTAEAIPVTVHDFPEVAEVYIRILTDEGAIAIANFEAGRTTRSSEFGSDSEYWWHLAESNSRVFIRRVEIKGTSL